MWLLGMWAHSNRQSLSCLNAKALIACNSLVPAFLHTKVAESCIRERKHMVTASYVSKEMQALNKRSEYI
jgi:alpha-aminoadipic semialdehyde synthase